jgi:hypothetical protein
MGTSLTATTSLTIVDLNIAGPIDMILNGKTFAVLAVIAASTAAFPAAMAQSGSMTQSRVGPFAIDYVTEKGMFDRCAATLSPGPNMLRIAYTKGLAYSISVPGVPVPAKTIDFHFGGETFSSVPATDPKRTRAWAAVDPMVINALMSVTGTIDISLGSKAYSWPIGRTRMEDVMVALENCTHKAMGHY